MTVTLPLSRDGGVHLYFFTVASTLCLLFVGRRDLVMLGLAALALALFVFCEFAATPGSTPLHLEPTRGRRHVRGQRRRRDGPRAVAVVLVPRGRLRRDREPLSVLACDVDCFKELNDR